MSVEPIPFAGMMEVDSSLNELIEALDQRYGNPYMAKEYGLIQEAIRVLREVANK